MQTLNKGTGAGGSNTNKNGLPYEKLTDLDDKIKTLQQNKYFSIINFNNTSKSLVKTKQSHLFECMKDEIDKNINKAHGCKNPDECYIDKEFKNIFIIEKILCSFLKVTVFIYFIYSLFY